jgi:ribosomal protein S18 acetylase RimI-like enzyme
MNHLLDNPIWNAMISHNSHLAQGNDQAKFFPENLSPFVGLATLADEGYQQLYNLLSFEQTAVLISGYKYNFPSNWTVILSDVLFQMTAENLIYRKNKGHEHQEIVFLTTEHVPQMISLTQLANPGPFSERTIEFGHYVGIFKSGELVAMAGKRMHPGNYTEISAVCTHPDHLGNGYGSRLITFVADRIKQEGNTPFLHVRPNNINAISLYKALGFTIRREMNLDVIKKTLKKI